MNDLLGEDQRFDVDKALQFLGTSRSRFLQYAGEWLTDFGDPVDVLMMLASETGQAVGPWESARLCCLLGLSPSSSVLSLLEDVLDEPVSGEPRPPISAAMAVAHAKDVLHEKEAQYARELVLALDAGRANTQVSPCLIDAALLSICHGQGAYPEAAVETAATRSLLGYLDDFPHFSTTILEAALLSSQQELIEKSIRVLGTHQQESGNVPGQETHVIRQGFITLRAVALFKRIGKQEVEGPPPRD
ncbi:MAG: hypothetical protein GY822_05150 [Deltaproteobacteria bacterium]|nr:hypothetical protein [Deltaproteobacteria bacterium]